MLHETFEKELTKLNPEQKSAILHGSGPLLVLAGAGSGKTRVVTLRILSLLKQGIPASQIIGVTFTNKAANEMKERVQNLANQRVHISTFHSLGAKILREFSQKLDLPENFAIYDEEESKKVFKACAIEVFNADLKDNEVQKLRLGISKIKNSSSLSFSSTHEERLFHLYQKRLKESGACDFDDLLYLPLELFQNHPDVLLSLQNRWTHILVDEYQDTNGSQNRFTNFLAGQQKNLFVVGDPDQSIYSWRGANIGHILSFQSMFPEASVIRLEENYRSTNTILEASNAVVKNNSARYEKNLWSNKGQGNKIGCFVGSSERDEAEFVVNTISSLHNRGTPYNEIAILFRTNAQSRAFEDLLIERKIPYIIWGGISFYQRKEIKDVLSYIRLAMLPQDRQAFERALKNPSRGIGDTTLEKLFDLSTSLQKPILDVAQDAVLGIGITLTKKQQKGLESFCQAISTLKSLLQENSPFKLVQSAIFDTGYGTVLESDPDTQAERRENLDQLIAKAQEWEESHDEESASKFLEELVLGSIQEEKEDTPSLILTTIHNAKGLEFTACFLAGLEEDLFPHINSKRENGSIEEERRLFYVGMTRAKEHLFLSAAQKRFLFGGHHFMRPSRFLLEVPKNLIEPLRKPRVEFARTEFSRAEFSKTEVTRHNTSTPFSIGQVIMHDTFGVGRIEKLQESEFGPIYEIFFSNDQKKRKIAGKAAPMELLQG